MCPHTAMYVCRYGIPMGVRGFRKRVEFGLHASYGKGGHRRGVYRSDPRYEKRRGGGGGGVRPFIHPSTVYLLNGEGDLALGKGSINPHLLPLRRIRHVVTQSYVLRTALQFTMLNKSKARQLLYGSYS